MIRRIFVISMSVIFLLATFTLSVLLCITKNPYQVTLGISAGVLALGELVYLIPRIIMSVHEGRESEFAFNVAKSVSSITRILFVLVLYHLICSYYNLPYNVITFIIYALATMSVIMVVVPKKEWVSSKPQQLVWKALTNIPLLLFGCMIIFVFVKHTNYSIWNPMNFYWACILVYVITYLPIAIVDDHNSDIELLMYVCYIALEAILVLSLFWIK